MFFEKLITDRGYTDHEHLDMFGLINMNGRMYDPQLGRFLSADILVQNADNPQNYNRYSYCLNNPLKYTDPSGYSYNRMDRGARWLEAHYSGSKDVYERYVELSNDRTGQREANLQEWNWLCFNFSLPSANTAEPTDLLSVYANSVKLSMGDMEAPPSLCPSMSLNSFFKLFPIMSLGGGKHGKTIPGVEVSAKAPGWYGDPSLKYTENANPAALTANILLWFLSGSGPSKLVYSPNSPSSKLLATSDGVREAINAFNSGDKNYTYQYSPSLNGDLDDFCKSLNAHISALINNNDVQLQVGTWYAEMSPIDNDYLSMKITNNVTLSSLMYHLTPNSWNHSYGPGRTINQTFYLIVPR